MKRTLASYFNLEQLLGKPDKRYDAFFASILESSSKGFPDNISIVSWNYDCQLEMAYSEYYLNHDGLRDIEDKLHLLHKTLQNINYQDDCKFRVCKLNGTSFMYRNDYGLKEPIDSYFSSQVKEDPLVYVAGIHNDEKLHSSISFAWDHSDKWFENQVVNSISDADVLVVIGYSFPFFNRTVDRLMFQTMSKIKKIYVQDKDPNRIIESLKFLKLSNTITPNFFPVYNTWQFYLPPEL